MVAGLAIAAVVAALDQATKWWILTRVMDPPRTIEVTPFFNLVMAWNRGVSFGLFDGDSPYNAWVLTALAVAIVIALLAWLARAQGPAILAGIGLVVGGAVGNVIDRLRFGAVADFLDFHAAGLHWPAFNLADSAITLGAVLLVLDSLFGGPESPKKGDTAT
ncbi:MAG: signal peptidase II [Hyphomicrobiales bacterium]|nr:signal peptidase II [Hyphomicrobiales bacterium]MCP5371143.1 signal peptidase II [Hyphomicrobiales bacterium]